MALPLLASLLVLGLWLRPRFLDSFGLIRGDQAARLLFREVVDLSRVLLAAVFGPIGGHAHFHESLGYG